LHYWVGSFCRAKENNNKGPFFPTGVIATCDIIKIVKDLGNQVPDKSWMLYLLELFNRQNLAMELNLICQFDNQDYFEAIFQGINRYRFKEVLPNVDNSYMRIITMDKMNRQIKYILTDQSSKQSETYSLPISSANFDYEGANQFTGIEWWNKIGYYPYPIRYQVETSQIMFGINESGDPDSVTFVPYNTMMPNKDENSTKYPVSFQDMMLKDGCLCYSIQPGMCVNGMRFNC
jgi:hypothetical protein